MNIVQVTRTFAVALVMVMIATGLWAAGAEEAPAAAADKQYVTDPTTGEVVEAPRYGGTLIFTRVSAIHQPHFVSGFLEKLSVADWGIDRDETDFRTTYVPVPSLKGALAESWEQPDPLTWIAHIRKGVRWQDKEPMNGREFDAYDVEWNYHRLLGLGSGFTEPHPWLATMAAAVESVTATDKWTVVYKLKGPIVGAEKDIFDDNNGWIYPPEVLKKQDVDAKPPGFGMPGIEDVTDLVGTGPFMLTEFVEGSSLTFVKNPDYWSDDEKYPGNRLPYIDELRAVIMPEVATRLAALRSGKVDFVGSHGDAQIRSIDLIENLQKTDPEIVVHQFFYRSGNSFRFNGQAVLDNPPFNDIRVRKAMQMAIDLETINSTFFKGYASTTPEGIVSKDVTGFAIPFEDWPEDVKKSYDYDPAGARQLIAEAGYPEGIEATLVPSARFDTTFTELIITYWSAIGVDVELRVMDEASGMTVSGNPDFTLFSWALANRGGFYYLPYYTSAGGAGFKDPAYDATVEAIVTATNVDEQMRRVQEANMYMVKEHWMIWGPEAPMFQARQPWVKGYNGELWLGRQNFYPVFARLWIDSELKAAMGH